jgi:gamma-glutamyltranspeptidase / glutathione hydrolase
VCFCGLNYSFTLARALDVACLVSTPSRRVGAELAELGHKVEVWPDRLWRAASVCAIIRDTKTDLLAGGADHRRDAYAIS